MVIKRKEHFYSLTETEHNILPVFTVQVWDNDIFTPDDFIGKCVLNLYLVDWKKEVWKFIVHIGLFCDGYTSSCAIIIIIRTLLS